MGINKIPTGMVVNGVAIMKKVKLQNQTTLKPLQLVAGLVILFGIITVGVLLTQDKTHVTAITKGVAVTQITHAGILPATISIDAGQQVTWTNTDSAPHRLKADSANLPGFDSSVALKPGDTYTYTFETAGTYHYYDPVNIAHFTGTVIVK